MGTILDSTNTNKISGLKQSGKTLVLTGGCFDILHAGHIDFLKRAKATGDQLLVILESDEQIRKLKGENRPLNSQTDRAAILSNLPFVSYILPLTGLQNDKDYEILVKQLKPDIIATSGSDKVFDWEKNLAEKGLLKIIKVMDRKGNYSTTNLVSKIKI